MSIRSALLLLLIGYLLVTGTLDAFGLYDIGFGPR